MSGCHYTGCVDLNIPCSLAHLSFSVVVICELPLLALKSPQRMEKRPNRCMQPFGLLFTMFLSNVSIILILLGI